jgi:cell division protein FtsQ
MAGGTKGSKKKLLRIFLVLSLLVLIIASVITFFWLINRRLFSKNQHFTLKYVQVESPGWWNARSAKVADIMGVTVGKTNIFALRLTELRKKLEREPSIKNVTVERILPDIIRVKIQERIPRAILEKKNSGWLVDASGIVMSQNSCIKISKSLPVIYGISKDIKLQAGLHLPQLKPALEVIQYCITDFPEFKILGISLKNSEELVFAMYLGKQKWGEPYKVNMPKKDYKFYLDKLKRSLRNVDPRRDPLKDIILNYKGRVIKRPRLSPSSN